MNLLAPANTKSSYTTGPAPAWISPCSMVRTQGERHVLHTFPRHVTEMVIALTRWGGKVADVSRHQVIISVGLKIKGEFAFNTLAKVSSTETLIPFESGVPTLAELEGTSDRNL